MERIIVKNSNLDNLLNEFLSLYLAFKNVSLKEKRCIDISNLKWINPLTVLFLGSYINMTGSRYEANQNIESYLRNIKFPGGISHFNNILKKDKTYIPICSFKKDDASVIDGFTNLIQTRIVPIKQIEGALFLAISELFDNVSEHSKTKKGFICSQYYTKKQYLENCIIDNGIGLKQSYINHGIECESDEKAIELAISGKSTKPESGRGYGLSKTIEMICDLRGEILLVSGSAFVFLNSKQSIRNRLDEFYWEGLIVAFRIPKTNEKIELYKYYE
jgi:anti-sigma regulatory factor (Ser/Thr protein kinase)